MSSSDESMASSNESMTSDEGSITDSSSGDQSPEPMSDCPITSSFPGDLSEKVILENKEEILKLSPDDWDATYRQLVPMMREQLVEKIFLKFCAVRLMHKNPTYREIIKKFKMLLEDEDVAPEDALRMAIQSLKFRFDQMIPF